MCDEKLPPAEELAKTIAENLLAEGLIPARRADAIKASIQSGVALESDWRLWVYSAQVDSDREEARINGEETN